MTPNCEPTIAVACPQKSKIDKLMNRVLDGQKNLSSRMDAQETISDELVKLVKGEKEGEGLQCHMTEIRTVLRFVRMELAGVFSLLLVIATFLALKR